MHAEPVDNRPIVILAYPGIQPLDVVGPHEVFAAANVLLHHRGQPGYVLSLVAATGTEVRAESGIRLGTDPLPDPATLAVDTLVLPGGDGVHTARHDPATIEWIRAVAARCRRVATVCTGTFLAAEAGLLSDRTVTTHWARAARLQREFPDVHVDPDPIYVQDGAVWTSAGVTAGIDLALALVDDDHGGDVAQTVARWLVMFLHRPGGQTQFAAPVWLPRAERSAIRAVQRMIDSSPSADHRVDRLAAAAAMSVRHFGRVFTSEVGETPGRYVERVRVEAARRALETTDDNLALVAVRCGLGSAENLRRAFHRRLGVSPDAYRRRFRVA